MDGGRGPKGYEDLSDTDTAYTAETKMTFK